MKGCTKCQTVLDSDMQCVSLVRFDERTLNLTVDDKAPPLEAVRRGPHFFHHPMIVTMLWNVRDLKSRVQVDLLRAE